jgi:hypothetical protein
MLKPATVIMDALATLAVFQRTVSCRALVLYSITSGNYGNVKLDGMDVIYAGSWPKAIHDGNGTAQIFVSNKATPAQRDALVKIIAGQAKGREQYNIFQTTSASVIAGFCAYTLAA